MLPLRDQNPRIRFPLLTLCLIAINIFIYVWYIWLNDSSEIFIKNYALHPDTIKNMIIGKTTIFNLKLYLPVITSMFLHGSWLHLLGNCWMLWIFGDNVEGVLGKLSFLIFYFLSGIVASLAHVITTHTPEIPIIGASGAVAGVMGAYLVLFPRAKIYTFVPLIFIWVIPIRAFIFLLIWFSGQLLNGWIDLFTPQYQASNIAFWAHIGGFVIGVVGGILFKGRMLELYKKKVYHKYRSNDNS